MEWLAEHAQPVYFLLGLGAVALAVMGTSARKWPYFAGAGAAALGLLAFWLVIHTVTTDATRIEANLQALAKALLAKDQDAALGFIADDFKYKTKSGQKWVAIVSAVLEEHKIDDLRLRSLEVKNISRADRQANVFFHLEALAGGTVHYSAECPWKMALDGDVWKVEHVQIRKEHRPH